MRIPKRFGNGRSTKVLACIAEVVVLPNSSYLARYLSLKVKSALFMLSTMFSYRVSTISRYLLRDG